MCGADKGTEFYYVQNKIACIQKYFECRNFSIRDLLYVFNLLPGFQNTEGIGFMKIENDNNNLGCPIPPTFKIT
jgi:hypothetical protein